MTETDSSSPQALSRFITRHRFLWLTFSGLTLAALDPLGALAKKKCKHGTMTVTRKVNGKKTKVKICRPAPPTPTLTETPTPTATSAPLTIRNVATAHGIEVGIATGISGISWPAWAATLTKHFNMGLISDVLMTNFPPNPDFWPAPSTHNFGFVDTEVSFLRDHELTIYWEPLLSGTVYAADWLKNGTFSPDEMRQLIQNHITLVMNRYKADIHHWNVVTEPVPAGWAGDDPFSKVLGDGYIDLAFETARSIDPSATLTFVDNSNVTPTSGKYQWDIQTVRRLRNKTVTVDGHAYHLIDRMNVECYIDATNPPTPEDLAAAVDGFRQLGVDVQVDLTVAIDSTSQPTADLLTKQADVYRMAMEAYLKHGVKTFIIWGLHDGGSFPVGKHAVLFDDNLQPKPAYSAVLEVLQNPPAPIPAPTAAPPPITLRSLSAKAGLQVGAVIGTLWDPAMYALLQNEFDFGQIDWDLGWKSLEPSRGSLNFGPADADVQYIQQGNMQAQALRFLWELFDPLWLQQGTFSHDDMVNLVTSHIQTVMTRYKGKIHQWIVAYGIHPLSWGGAGVVQAALGDDYLPIVYRAARAADPSATLIYGDSNNFTWDGGTSSVTANNIDRLLALKLIDGVGIQMNLDAAKPPSNAEVIDVMRSYGVPVHVTQFDVNLKNVPGTDADRFALQAQIYRDMLSAAIESGVCKSFSFYTVGDKYSWLESDPSASYYAPNADATPFDNSLQPKPAYMAIRNVLTDPPAIAPPSVASGSRTLRELADAAGVKLGAVQGGESYSARYRNLLITQFNYCIVTGGFTWGGTGDQSSACYVLRPDEHTYDFSNLDAAFEFTQTHGLTTYAEGLLWGHSCIPDWLTRGNYTPDELRGILTDHIRTMVTRYKGAADAWGVVLEPQWYQGSNDFWFNHLGESYIDLAFQTARQADPSAVLVFDDAADMTLSGGSATYDMSTITRLRNSTVTVNGRTYPLVDGLGIQVFVDIVNPPSKDDLVAALVKYRSLGVDLYVTGSSVTISDAPGTLTDRLAAQANVYRTLMEAYFGSGLCKHFLIFGLYDGGVFGIGAQGNVLDSGSQGALFDQNYQPKPAYYAVADALSSLLSR